MPPTQRSAAGVRRAELLAALVLGADLGMARPMEYATRQCVLALRMGERLSFDDGQRAVLHYVSLIAWVGCHIDAYEQAKWFGDDLALKGGFRHIDPVGLRAARQFLTAIGTKDAAAMLHNHAYAAHQLTAELDLPSDVRDAVAQTFARWDGRGAPEGVKATDIMPTDRGVRVDVAWAVHPKTFWRRLLFAKLRRTQLADEVPASLAALAYHLAPRDMTV